MRNADPRPSSRAPSAPAPRARASLAQLLAASPPREACIVPGSPHFAIDASFALDPSHGALARLPAIAPALPRRAPVARDACETLGTLP